MVRTLLTSPKANGYFNRAIIQSDPQAYGANNASVSQRGIGMVIQESLGCSNLTCLQNASVDDILNSQNAVYQRLSSIPAINPVYPFGPNLDEDFVPNDFGPSLVQGHLEVPVDIMMGVVKDEAGPTIFGQYPTGISSTLYQAILEYELGGTGAGLVLKSGLFDNYVNNTNYTNGSGYLWQLESVGTEYEFSCPGQFNAQNIANKSLAQLHFYEFVKGITFASNTGIVECENGAVCHQDDLYAVFGTYTNATTAQVNLAKEVQSRWAAFAKSGNPNADGYNTWPAAIKGNLNVLQIGGENVVNGVDSAQCAFLDRYVPFNWE